MPLVFVHGVSNRLGKRYDAGVRARDTLFRSYLLSSRRRSDGAQIPILNPYWGDLGGKLRWNGASLPLDDDVESLGSGPEALAELYASALPDDDVELPDQVVLEVARRSLPAAVDLLWAASVIDGTPADFAFVELAVPTYSYAVANPNPAWLGDVANDNELVTRLADEVQSGVIDDHAASGETEEWETLGLGTAWEAIRRGAKALQTAVTGRVGRGVSARIRPAVTPGVVKFLGDVFVYLHQQHEHAGPIRDLVAGAIRDARRAAESDDQLVVVAHSMGGNIVYDLLTGDLSDLEVPLLITAGTQIGFFEELKLFTSSNDAIPAPGSSAKVAKPPNVKRWINIFDHSDLLGFRVAPIIDGVDDFMYVTGSLLNAHGQYFVQPGFHDRLAKRVGAAS